MACSRVLGVLENWETLDLAALDMEDVFNRFVNLRGKDFTPESLLTYKSRFNQGVTTFLAYAKDPAGWNRRRRPRAVRRATEQT